MTCEIEGAALVVASVGRWSPNDLAYVEKLSVWGQPSSLRLVAWFQLRGNAWPDLARPMSRVELLFDGVSGLELRGFGGGRTQVMGFEIVDVSDRRHQGIRFEVHDYEDGRILFRAAGVSVLSADPPELITW